MVLKGDNARSELTRARVYFLHVSGRKDILEWSSGQTRSNKTAIPCPPPMQAEPMAYLALRRTSS